MFLNVSQKKEILKIFKILSLKIKLWSQSVLFWDEKLLNATKNAPKVKNKKRRKRLKFQSENSENFFDVTSIKSLVYKESLISVISSEAIKITGGKYTTENLWKTMDT